MNLRKIGGKEHRPRLPHIRDKEEENPALETDEEEEEFDFPYRFTDSYIDTVEHIHDLINDNGDYDQARELFSQNNIWSILVEDSRRLQHDLEHGMNLDTEEEQTMRELNEMVVDIFNELRQHFGKRKRGGAIPERTTDTLTNEESLIRRQIRFMRRLVEAVDSIMENQNPSEEELSRARTIARRLNGELDYFYNHYSEIATDEWLNDEGMMDDFNNIIDAANNMNQFFNLNYGYREEKSA